MVFNFHQNIYHVVVNAVVLQVNTPIRVIRWYITMYMVNPRVCIRFGLVKNYTYDTTFYMGVKGEVSKIKNRYRQNI